MALELSVSATDGIAGWRFVFPDLHRVDYNVEPLPEAALRFLGVAKLEGKLESGDEMSKMRSTRKAV